MAVDSLNFLEATVRDKILTKMRVVASTRGAIVVVVTLVRMAAIRIATHMEWVMV